MIGLLLNKYLIGGVLGLAIVTGVYLKGRSDGGASMREAAAKEAVKRIHQMENSNANFNRLSDRDRCLVFMRDSGLPDSACD